MKKILTLGAICVSLLLSVMTVHADLIWEPMGDSFYAEHASECEYVNRTFVANGAEGQVVVYKSPVSDKVVDTFEKGKNVYISHVYEDENGTRWGIWDNGIANKSGWVKMESMAVKYDSRAFWDEYGQQILEEEVTVGNGTEMIVNFWRYPGSEDMMEVKLGTNILTFSQIFVDEEGYKWACVGYFQGIREHWICVDAPSMGFEALYPNGAPKRGVLLEGTEAIVVEGTQYVEEVIAEKTTEEESAGADKKDKMQESDSQMAQIPFVAAIVAAVVAVTGALLVLLKRSFAIKNKKNG